MVVFRVFIAGVVIQYGIEGNGAVTGAQLFVFVFPVIRENNRTVSGVLCTQIIKSPVQFVYRQRLQNIGNRLVVPAEPIRCIFAAVVGKYAVFRNIGNIAVFKTIV